MKSAIRVEGLSKLYRVGTRQAAYHTLRETISEGCQAAWRRVHRSLARAASAWKVNGHPTTPLTRSFAQGDSAAANPADQPAAATDGAAGCPAASPRRAGDHFWALKDVSFEVQPGEVVGIIGRNGAGKSTLLKILSRITEPTAGRVELRGRVGSLLEVGTGFHPELTGRENIYLNGSLLGMSRREIERKFDEIVDFSGVEEFLDTPVKRYSSGMYVRLAFAVAAHLEPEILIVDEVLAVGDAEFQKKCLGKMQTIARGGRTVLFVSHNLDAIRKLCQSAILLENGQLESRGPACHQVSLYLSRLLSFSSLPLITRADREGNGAYRVARVKFLSSGNSETDSISSGDDLNIEITCVKNAAQCDLSYIALSCWTIEGHKIFHIDNLQQRHALRYDKNTKTHSFRLRLPHVSLCPGKYFWNVAIGTANQLYDHVYACATLTVINGDYYRVGRPSKNHQSIIFVDHQWEH